MHTHTPTDGAARGWWAAGRQRPAPHRRRPALCLLAGICGQGGGRAPSVCRISSAGIGGVGHCCGMGGGESMASDSRLACSPESLLEDPDSTCNQHAAHTHTHTAVYTHTHTPHTRRTRTHPTHEERLRIPHHQKARAHMCGHGLGPPFCPIPGWTAESPAAAAPAGPALHPRITPLFKNGVKRWIFRVVLREDPFTRGGQAPVVAKRRPGGELVLPLGHQRHRPPPGRHPPPAPACTR